MDGQEKLLDYETIKAAVAGEKWPQKRCWADRSWLLPSG
mgnify:CR=1 FL=1